MERSFVSITPLSVELTDTSALQRLSAAMPLDSPQGDESSEAVEEDE